MNCRVVMCLEKEIFVSIRLPYEITKHNISVTTLTVIQPVS